MENIFKDAYFGKQYRTRDGKKAIFHRNANDKVWHLIKEDIHERIPYNADGTCRGDDCHDIVSEWQEPIDGQKLAELAEELDPNNPHGYTYEEGKYFGFDDGFKKGYLFGLRRMGYGQE